MSASPLPDAELEHDDPNELTVVERPLLAQLVAMRWRFIRGDLDLQENGFLAINHHLIEHNYGDRFWALIRRVDHDFERKEWWLRENGGRYSL